jgi:two-component system cell cycle response regulator CtrA
MSDPLRDAYVVALENENEDLRIRVRELEEIFGFTNPVPLVFGLTGAESTVLGILVQRDMATLAQLMAALMRNRLEQDGPTPDIVKVYICKIREKLKRFGIEIDTVWGRGYTISRSNKDKIAAYLPQPEAEAAE